MQRIGRLLLWVVLLVIVAGVTFYERPLWVNLQITHFELFLSRVQSNYVLTPEGRVHYYDAEPRFAPEHGIPLVLVHGLGDRDESWAPMLRRLKRAGFHVYAPDLLGYGRSPKPGDSDYSIATQEKFVADFIQALGLQKPDIGGWSMGGWVALKLATDHPDMVDRVVVYDAAGIQPDSPVPSDAFHPRDIQGMQRLASLLEPTAKPLPNFVLRDALRVYGDQQWVVDKGVTAMLTGHDAVDATLPQLQNPLLIVWGSVDGMLPLAMGQKMHTLDPRSELDIVEGCGHLAPKTCSGRVAQATADFLKSNPAPSGGVRTLAAMNK
ncbi:Pimeloyl-ACP methyl ester carboxylesterase [Bryocella elongata]|uniref:Pimeloyl-ACP methyl ester carboxylesterase n=1 Tax=Bryocella elongata TaxID=863522 RepID=A0A1H5SDS6_9BACT|nr:alpha/beta hydrolase [Bryocella elongata]SEF48645.1 Pimeloyl-ACP methyl ester carboxylesterase [Bryocella elongata]